MGTSLLYRISRTSVVSGAMRSLLQTSTETIRVPGEDCIDLLMSVLTAYTPSVLEFPTMAEAEDAMKRLSGIDINGVAVEIRLAPVSQKPFHGPSLNKRRKAREVEVVMTIVAPHRLVTTVMIDLVTMIAVGAIPIAEVIEEVAETARHLHPAETMIGTTARQGGIMEEIGARRGDAMTIGTREVVKETETGMTGMATVALRKIGLNVWLKVAIKKLLAPTSPFT